MIQNSITKLDIKSLYELSLSIGKSLDFEQNCLSFTTALKKYLNLTSCSVWLQSEENDSEFKQVFKNNQSILKSKKLPKDSKLLKHLKVNSFLSINSNDVAFIENADLFYIKKGVIYFVKASASIFLVLQNIKSKTVITEEKIHQLKPLLNLFSISVETVLTRDQLMKERTQNQEITEQLRHYKMMVENISDGILISDLDNKVIFINDQLAKMSGYDKEDILNSKTGDLHFYEDQKDEIEKKIKRSFKGFQGEYEIALINKKNEQKWWAMVKVSPFKNREGKIIGAIGVIRDITSQKQVENSLIESEWKFRNYIEKSPIGMAISDSPTSVLVNERFCEMLGYTKKEFTKHTLVNKITHPEDKLVHLEGYKKLLEGKVKSFNVQKRYIRKDGSIMWGNLTLSIFKDEEKNTITNFEMVEDIHDQKIMNDSLAFISQINSSTDSNTLFNAITKQIAKTFELPYVLVVEVDHEGISCTSRSFWQNGEFTEFSYSLKNSACQDAIDKKEFFIVNEKVQKKYPKFEALKALNAESYIASPLCDTNNKVIGLIILIDTKKIQNAELIKRILKIYSSRSASELERLKSNQILLESSNKLKEAERIAKIGSWEYTFETQDFYISEGLQRLFNMENGKSPQDIIKNLRGAVHPGDKQRLDEVIENIIKKGKPWEIELRYKINNKTIHTINKGQASFANGQIVSLFGTIQDISYKKEVETNLQVATSKYQDLLENMNDAVVILDISSKIIDFNQAVLTLLQYPKSDLLGLEIKDLVHPDDMENSKRYFQKLRKDGFYRDYQGRIITKNKEVKYIQVDSDAIYKNGIMVGSRDIVRDITKLKEIERKRELLYQKVEEANKELKDFAYIVSHDLKAPLRAIGSLAQWLSEDYMEQIDEKGQKQLTLLNNRVHRMHNFIDGILEYSRLGRIKVSKESVDINKLVESVIDSLDTKNNTIEIKTDLPVIKCEKIRIYQVFQNLISNSIKYNDKKQGKIVIDYKELPNAHQFSIADNGPGIDEKYHDKIFQIFQTLQVRDKFESTGIGLTIVKRIVELHGGTVIVKSTVGKGAKFVFTLNKK